MTQTVLTHDNLAQLLQDVDCYEAYQEAFKHTLDEPFWLNTQRKNTPAAYESYLTNYPNGLFRREATSQLDNLIAREEKEAFDSLISWANIFDIPESKLPREIKLLKDLTELDLRNHRTWRNDLISYLPESIGTLTNLTVLILTNMKLTKFPESIGNLINLESLGLGRNQLTKLPESIDKLTNLKAFAFEKNQLTELPESVSKLTNLEWLDLSGNQLTELPESISKLTNLKWLDLSENQLAELPESISKLTNLGMLELASNQLAEFPESISKLTNLEILGLASNQLAEFPESISKLTNLEILGLASNQFVEFPESISKLTNLKMLDLSENQLTTLPKSFNDLVNLVWLDINNNHQFTVLKFPKWVNKLLNAITIDNLISDKSKFGVFIRLKFQVFKMKHPLLFTGLFGLIFIMFIFSCAFILFGAALLIGLLKQMVTDIVRLF